jgi:hypothetical protein
LNVGIIKFVTNSAALYSSTLPLIGGVLCLFGIIAGIAILVNDRRRHAVGIIFGVAMTFFFIYQLIMYQYLYNFEIALFSLIALILIIVSRLTTEHVYAEKFVEDTARYSNLPEGVQNVGRF